MNRYVPVRIRRAVVARDKGVCRYCGGVANSIDHVIPVSLGGEHTVENIVQACTSCNSSKGPIPPFMPLPQRSLDIMAKRVAAGGCLFHGRPGTQIASWYMDDEAGQEFTLEHCSHRGCPPMRCYYDGHVRVASQSDVRAYAHCDYIDYIKPALCWMAP